MSTVRAKKVLWPMWFERSEVRSIEAATDVVVRYSCQRAARAGAAMPMTPMPTPHTQIHRHIMRFTTVCPARKRGTCCRPQTL